MRRKTITRDVTGKRYPTTGRNTGTDWDELNLRDDYIAAAKKIVKVLSPLRGPARTKVFGAVEKVLGI